MAPNALELAGWPAKGLLTPPRNWLSMWNADCGAAGAQHYYSVLLVSWHRQHPSRLSHLLNLLISSLY